MIKPVKSSVKVEFMSVSRPFLGMLASIVFRAVDKDYLSVHFGQEMI